MLSANPEMVRAGAVGRLKILSELRTERVVEPASKGAGLANR